MINSLSVDVEEYFHASNLEVVAPPRDWHRLQSRVVPSTEQILEMFARTNCKGTFFILGYVAARHPALVRAIAAQGHEIASHGYSHRLAFSQTPKQFFRDVLRSKRLLEDISGKPVLGYRAPSFSIRSGNSWAYDCLLEAGYRYDSSLYPIRHPRYANQDRPLASVTLDREKGKLFIMPLAVQDLHFFGREIRLPVAGGAYWRLFPRSYIHWALSGLDRKRSFNCYIHPWEVDAAQPRFEQLSFLTKLRHYGGVKTFANTVEHFLRSFKFAPLEEVARSVFGSSFDQPNSN